MSQHIPHNKMSLPDGKKATDCLALRAFEIIFSES